MMDIKIFRRQLRLKTPFRIAHGTFPFRESIFIRVEKNGYSGYGEAPVVPYYGLTPEAVEGDLRKVVSSFPRGIDVFDWDPVFTYPTAASAFRSAVLNLRSRIEAVSAYEVLGLEQSTEVPRTSFTIAYKDSFGEILRQASGSGFRRLKIKVGFPGDVQLIEKLKKKLPDLLIRVDVNQGWSLEEAFEKLPLLERIGVEFVEEPIAGTPRELESLAQSTTVPIVLDESVVDAEGMERYITEAPHVAGIVVKIAKNGGPLESLSLIKKARAAGLKVMLSSMVESSLGVASALPLAQLCSWLDLDAPLLLADDPFTGLNYGDERPILAPAGIRPTERQKSYVDSLPSVYSDCSED